MWILRLYLEFTYTYTLYLSSFIWLSSYLTKVCDFKLNNLSIFNVFKQKATKNVKTVSFVTNMSIKTSPSTQLFSVVSNAQNIGK